MVASHLLYVLINAIINQYFYNSYCIIILSENNEALKYRGNVPIITIKVENATVDDSLIFRRYGCQEIIIQHSTPSTILQQLEYQMKRHDDRFNFRKYLIITDNMEIFNVTILEYVVNLLVVIPEENPDEEGVFKLLTHKYVGEADHNHPQVLDFWTGSNNSFVFGNNLFPEKILNQHGRILKCATFNYKPYSIIEESPMIAIGSENAIAHEYAKRLNMTIQYVLDDMEWGIIYDDGTGNGILGNVAIDKADIGYGALYTWAHEYGFLDLSKPVVRTGITCLVPAPKLAEGWLTPFFPFSFEMWLCFGISFVLISVATIGITGFITKRQLEWKYRHARKKKNVVVNYRIIFNQCMIRLVKIFLMQSVAPTGKNVDVSLKYLFSVFLYSLIITACYSSGLATVMTIPRYVGMINSVWDLANSHLKWGATQDAWIYSMLEEERPQYRKILEKFVATTEDNLQSLAKTNQFACSIERLPSGQYAIGNYVTEDILKNLRLMHEDLYWEYCVFMLRKSSPLLQSLDDLILQLNEAGLIKFWEKKAVQTHMNMRVQNIVGYYAASQVKERDRPVVKLNWIHVQGTFGLLLGGYVLSILCFVIEIVYKKCFYTRIPYRK